MPTTKMTTGQSFSDSLHYASGNGTDQTTQKFIESLPKTEAEGIIDGFDFGKRARLISTNLSSKDIKKLARQFDKNAKRRSDIKNPVLKVSINLKPGEKLSDQQLVEMANDYRRAMDLENCPFAVFEHREKPHQHLHLIFSRIDFDGKLIGSSYDRLTARTWAREAEKEFHLTPTPQRASRKLMTGAEKEKFQRDGTLSWSARMQSKIEETLHNSAGKFAELLETQNVGVIVYYKNKKPYGISFAAAGKKCAGGKLGTDFTWNGLIARGMDYRAERDDEILNAVSDLSRQKFSTRSAVAEKSKSGSSKPEKNDFISSNNPERVSETSNLLIQNLANEISPEKSVESPTLRKVHYFKKSGSDVDVDLPFVETKDGENLTAAFFPAEDAKNNSSNTPVVQDTVTKQTPAHDESKDENSKPGVRDFTIANRENLIGQLIVEFNEELKSRTGEELNFSQREGLERLYRIQDKNPRTDKQLDELDVLQKKFDEPLSKPNTSFEGEVIKFDHSSDDQKLEILRRRFDYVKKNTELMGERKENAEVPVAVGENQTSLDQTSLDQVEAANYAGKETSASEINIPIDDKITSASEHYLVAPPVASKQQTPEIAEAKSAFLSKAPLPLPAAKTEEKAAGHPTFISSQSSDNLFQTQAAALRDKSFSEYWWKMRAEADDSGSVTLSPAAFELLRVVYKQTFHEDVKNFDNIFNESEVTEKFLQTLDHFEKNSGIYAESIASVNKTILQSRQLRGDGTLALTTDGMPSSRDRSDLYLERDELDVDFSDYHQNDKIYAELQSIFEQAGMERILEVEKVSASFQTLGASPAKYQLTVEDDAISFGKITAAGQNSPGEKIQGVTFAAGSAGNYQYASSFTRDLKNEAVAHDLDQAAAFETVTAWNNDGLGENIIVTQFDAADDENMTAGIEAANRENLEKYLSRQKGFELIGEIAVRAAAFDAAEFRRASAKRKLTITATIAGREIKREISQNELLRERQAIARADVAAMKKTGILGMIGEDENKPLAAVERREYARALIKAEKRQQPLAEALDAAIVTESAKLDKLTESAERRLSEEKERTALMAKQTSGEKSAGVKATVMPEIIWIEQNKAVRRGDAETFSRLEEIHRASGLPRPNDVFARLKAMEAIADSRNRQARAALIRWSGDQNISDEKIIVTLKREDGKLLINNWQVTSKDDVKSEKKAADNAGRTEDSSVKAQTEYEQTAAKSADYASRAADLRKSADKTAFQPMMNKINPLSPIQGTLSWITSPKDTSNAQFNPLEIIKNDPGVQIVRAVADYIDKNKKAAELEELAREILAATDRPGEKLNEKSAGRETARLSNSVKAAIKNEEKLRDKLKQNPGVNQDLLDTPERSLSGAEIKQVGETAIKTGDAVETREYREFIKLGDECAEAVGATEHTLAADSLLAEARAVWQANQAVTALRPLADGSIEVEVDPAQLSSAVEHLNTADVLGEFQPEFAARSALGNLALDDALHLETLLPQNSPLTDVLNNQVTNIGNDLMEQFREPINAADQQIMKELTLSAETQNRFAQIRQNDQYLDAMAEQAELAALNQVPFQGAAQNFTVINPNDAVEAREMNFWAKDRADREAKIAAEQVQSRSLLTDEQKTEKDAAAMAEIERNTTQEQGREGSSRKM